MLGDDVLLNALRDALNHLYDPERLRKSPLIDALGLSTSPQPTARLQQTLIDAIHAMKPAPSEPVASIRRRIYSVLQLRYEQQFAQKEVAAQMGLGVRQYRRLQQNALQALALRLTEQFAHAPHGSESAEAMSGDLPEALEWIARLAHDEVSQVDQVLQEALKVVRPLAQRHGKMLIVEAAPAVAGSVHPLVLRQALLALFNAVILHSADDKVTTRIANAQRNVTVQITGRTSGKPGAPLPSAVAAEVAMAASMLGHFGGTAFTRNDAATGIFKVELRCRAAGMVPVLVVDDHADTLDLLRRYTVGTPYTLIAVTDPQEAFDLAVVHQPCAIVLDVMMPQMDGWEVLTQLKQDVRTAHLPVLVCTVLDQSELALSLGATGFLRKPVTRPALLAALDAHGVQLAPESS